MVLLVAVWGVSLLSALLPLEGVFSCYLYVHTQKTCTAFSGCSDECFYVVVCSSLVIVLFGMIFPLLLHVVLFCKTRNIQRHFIGSQEKSVAIASFAHTSILPATSRRQWGMVEMRRLSMCFSNSGERGGDLEERRGDEEVGEEGGRDSGGEERRRWGKRERGMIEEWREEERRKREEGRVEVGEDHTEIAMGNRLNSTSSAGSLNDSTIDNPLSRNTEGAYPTLEGAHATHDYLKGTFSGTSEKLPASLTCASQVYSSRPSTTILPAVTSRKSNASEVKFGSSSMRTSITMFILLMSVIGCTTPAFTLYRIQFLYLTPQRVLFIVNMMVGWVFQPPASDRQLCHHETQGVQTGHQELPAVSKKKLS